MDKVVCSITKEEADSENCYKASTIPRLIFQKMKLEYPELTPDSFISIPKVKEFQKKYLSHLINEESTELDRLEKEVLESIEKNEILSENIEPTMEHRLTFGEKISDQLAEFGGSWTFIFSFFTFILIWISINVGNVFFRPFDVYPFILLNLLLSCVAAIQAPIIMMSQNRQEQKDRIRSEHDYKINLKAELEIKLLHEKIDYLIAHQNRKLLEIQEIQASYLDDISSKLDKLPY
ncbi:PF06210 family protein [Leptospira inadai serovar Lyme str. 10]|uniref:PF06210 family protein n=2 Tax=Leptospira inadai serovar Lyme TaxID=293084 RepID=V6HEX5_9LEPT|nr:DUF1003 domain-containing protein [Leptospira inadai]EQA37993.1 PF06210 family protein [Leptospira inadai serovar Lyme str. 10]PNV74966.1 DUF1003 domain-containing protein [Leptospira inadai serovar Lyme]